MESKYSERYWRVDFESAKLLKQAGFMETCEMYWYDNVPIKVTNTNKGMPSNKASAPLIAVALEWCKDKGYFAEQMDYIWAVIGHKEFGGTFNIQSFDTCEESFPKTEREQSLLFIQTVCNHLISK